MERSGIEVAHGRPHCRRKPATEMERSGIEVAHGGPIAGESPRLRWSGAESKLRTAAPLQAKARD